MEAEIYGEEGQSKRAETYQGKPKYKTVETKIGGN